MAQEWQVGDQVSTTHNTPNGRVITGHIVHVYGASIYVDWPSIGVFSCWELARDLQRM